MVKRDPGRILTTHVGSLARPDDLIDLIRRKDAGQEYDRNALARRSREAVQEVIRRQAEAGIDIVDDGEQAKSSFAGYIAGRLGGFEDRAPAGAGRTKARSQEWARSREWQAFPDFYQWSVGEVKTRPPLTCTGPITYRGHEELRADIENLRAALNGVEHADAFMPAISPAHVAALNPDNEHYRSYEEYEHALADALREEYRAIVDAGFVVQIDDPRWLTYYTLHPDLSVADWRRWATERIEVVNYAIRGLPRDRVRFHTCYSINIGPRIHELALSEIADLLVRIDAGGYSFEGANPRHEHEYHVWERVRVPDDTVLIPGVITHTTNIVEHPELVAERIVRFANIVGRDRVIAGADCGFSTGARTDLEIHPSVVWPKMAALAEGARIASARLWGR